MLAGLKNILLKQLRTPKSGEAQWRSTETLSKPEFENSAVWEAGMIRENMGEAAQHRGQSVLKEAFVHGHFSWARPRTPQCTFFLLLFLVATDKEKEAVAVAS